MVTELIRRMEEGNVSLSAIEGGASKPPTGADTAGRSALRFVGFIFTGQRAIALDWLTEAVAISRRPTFEQRALWAAWDAENRLARSGRAGSENSRRRFHFF